MWLQNLQPRRAEGDVLFVHASPREPLYEYVLREDFLDDGFGPSQKAKDMFAAFQWLCFCGHSHRPGVVGQDFQWVRPEELKDATHVLKRGYKTLINVGSVGQPRDAIPAACYCIFDYTEPSDVTKTAKLAPIRGDKPTPPEIQNAETQRITPPSEEAGPTDDTRTSAELQKARDTLLMDMPRVTFRRVVYDVAAAQARFRLHPELPDGNALRLARGL
jgi:diadenosine tetraphosphatase ApaH/serine/threonine PP2A family protein phosphatase